ncbi:hypothetical protein, partial [Acinetobacter baumannii]|uniref:hypothetical protein n=1 Tax=Acinetobacter baumannii TaxID=470 RepID=UPI001177D3B7
MTVKITQRIKGFKVVDETLERPATATSGSDGTASKAVNVVDVVELKGNQEVEYDGEVNTAANLFDALKEGYYG